MSEKQGDWQLKYSVIKDRGGHILQTGRWSDCSFSVSEAHFSAHKLLLAMASPVFEAMFYGEIAEKDAIDIPDVDPEAFEAMLEYIYTDKINVSSFEEATALYYCGNKYMLPYLTEGCVDYLTNNLNPANVCQTYEFTKMFDEYELMDTCLQMMQVETTEVLNNDRFLEAKQTTVEDIFCLIPLNIENELELFKAAERYAEANADKEISLQDPENNLVQDFEKNKENDKDQEPQTKEEENNISQKATEDRIRTLLEETYKRSSIFRSLLDKILLLTLTPQQFAEEVARSPYITKDEAFAVLMNVATDNTDISMPKGFNEFRKPRYKIVPDLEYNEDLGIEKSKTRSQTKFRFTIPDFKKSKRMSMPFVVRKLSWRIATNPKPEKSLDQECLGIFLYCDYIDKSAMWSCSVVAEINVISNKSNAVHLLKKLEHVFTSTDRNRGSIIPMEKILNPKNGYVKNDSITIELILAALEPTGI